MRKLFTLFFLLATVMFVKAEESGYDLSVDAASISQQYFKGGDLTSISVTVKNVGTRSVQGFNIEVSVDEGEATVFEYTSTVNASRSTTKKIEYTIPDGLSVGAHKIYVKSVITKEGVVEDDYDNNVVGIDFAIYDVSLTYPHFVLMEQFTGIACVNCPRADKTLESVRESRDDVVWIAHHAGYYDDELTISGSKTIANNFGINYAPACMIDRSVLTGSAADFVVSSSTSDVNKYINLRQSSPCYVNINGIERTYNYETSSLEVKVTGERNETFASMYDNANVTIFLVENNCYAETEQSGEPTKHYHNNVLRMMPDGSYGTPINWVDNKFEYSTSVTLPKTDKATYGDKAWDPDQMRVVVLVNKPFGNKLSSEVFNAREVYMTEAAVKGIGVEKYNVYFENGAVVAENADSIEVYTIDGRRVANADLANGLYIIRLHINGKYVTVKRGF
jgi:hypothetical protein